MSEPKKKSHIGLHVADAFFGLALAAIGAYGLDAILFRVSLQLAEEGLVKNIAYLQRRIEALKGKGEQISKFPMMTVVMNAKERRWYRISPDIRYDVQFHESARLPLSMSSSLNSFMASLNSANNFERFMDIEMPERQVLQRKRLLKRLQIPDNPIMDKRVNRTNIEVGKMKDSLKYSRLAKFNDDLQRIDKSSFNPLQRIDKSSSPLQRIDNPSYELTPVNYSPRLQEAAQETPNLQKAYQRRLNKFNKIKEDDDGVAMGGGGGGGGYNVAKCPYQGTKHEFKGVRKSWTKKHIDDRLRELKWNFIGQRTHPTYRYVGDRDELLTRTLIIPNGPMNYELTPKELQNVMEQCGYW